MKTERQLKIAITKAKSELKLAITLADKIIAKRQVVDAEEALHQFKLNYFGERS